MDMNMTNIIGGAQNVEFMPHGQCWFWTWPLIDLHVISDIIIAFSYFSIPIALLLVFFKKPNIPFKLLFLMFAGFITTCGLTHIMSVITIWEPWFWAEGYIKLLCAIISVITTIAIYPLIPAIVALKSRSEYQEDINRLETAIINRDEIIDKLMKVNLSIENFNKKLEK